MGRFCTAVPFALMISRIEFRVLSTTEGTPSDVAVASFSLFFRPLSFLLRDAEGDSSAVPDAALFYSASCRDAAVSSGVTPSRVSPRTGALRFH